MEKWTKRKLIYAGSISTTLIVGAGIGFGLARVLAPGGSEVITQTSANEKGIGAFSNLDSFEKDGFNKGVLSSAEGYISNYEDNDYYYSNDLSIDQKTSSYSDDGHEYVDMLIEYYDSNDIIISAGFQVAQAITGVQGDFDGVFTDKEGNNTKYANSINKSFVLLDDSSLASMYNNVSSISYAAEGAGYLAGRAAIIYTEYDAIVNHGDSTQITEENYTPNIVMWGGVWFPTVYDYMSGFAQAITEFNNTITENPGSGLYPITLWSGGSKDGDSMDSTNSYDESKSSSSSYSYSSEEDPAMTWYTGGFDAADNTSDGALASVKTKNAVNSEASVIFPVAGGNTTVAQEVLLNSSETTSRLIGVDTDATISPDNEADLYLGTASKNLVLGGELGLWAMDDFDGDGIRNFQEYKYADIDENDSYSVDANDQYGLSITAEDGYYNEWLESDSMGVHLRGDIDNDGVSFIYGDETSAGMNPSLDAAIIFFFGGAPDPYEAFDNYLNYDLPDFINNEDSNFIPVS